MNKKIGIVSLGCPKNLVDSEIMLGILNERKYEITNKEDEADIIIVNTCGFIESAKQESVNAILEMAQYKKDKCDLLIVTGCLAERYKEEIMKEIPEVDVVLGTGNYSSIADVIAKAYGGEKQVLCGKREDVNYLDGNRLVSTKKGYAYLKIAEGCDNCCTYCIIPSLRGRYRSRNMEAVVSEACRLADDGVKEIILVAQDITRYGLDVYGEKKLVPLIRELGKIQGIHWIRLLYCYPEMIDDDLINEVAENPKVCKYIDVPVQHASDKILRAMNRRGSSKDIETVLMKLRERISGLVLRTSIIVGFPGEDEKDFEILCDFIKKIRFDRLGVFTYSKEEGTPAAKLKPQVSLKLKKERYNKVMSMQREISNSLNKQRVNKIYTTLVEGVAEDGIFYYGRTYAEAPEIDNVVYFTSRVPLETGQFVDVKIVDAGDYDLTGDVVDEFGE